MPLNPVVGLEGVVIVPPRPETTDQVPEPIVAVLPNIVVEVPQMFWSAPAFATVGLAVPLKVRSNPVKPNTDSPKTAVKLIGEAPVGSA